MNARVQRLHTTCADTIFAYWPASLARRKFLQGMWQRAQVPDLCTYYAGNSMHMQNRQAHRPASQGSQSAPPRGARAHQPPPPPQRCPQWTRSRSQAPPTPVGCTCSMVVSALELGVTAPTCMHSANAKAEMRHSGISDHKICVCGCTQVMKCLTEDKRCFKAGKPLPDPPGLLCRTQTEALSFRQLHRLHHVRCGFVLHLLGCKAHEESSTGSDRSNKLAVAPALNAMAATLNLRQECALDLPSFFFLLMLSDPSADACTTHCIQVEVAADLQHLSTAKTLCPTRCRQSRLQHLVTLFCLLLRGKQHWRWPAAAKVRNLGANAQLLFGV